MPAAASAETERGEGAEQRHREFRLDYFLAQDLAERDRPAQRLVGVHFPHLGANRVQQQIGIAGGAHGQRTLGGTENGVGEQDRRDRISAQAVVSRIRDDANDGDFRWAGGVDHDRPRWAGQRVQAEARADRVLSRGPQLERRLVDHGDAVAAADFGGVEHASGAQRNAECAQVIRAGQVDADALRVVRVLPEDSEWRLEAAEREPEGRAFDARQGIDALQQLLREAIARVERRVLGRGQRD